jgi:hypothetical protein
MFPPGSLGISVNPHTGQAMAHVPMTAELAEYYLEHVFELQRTRCGNRVNALAAALEANLLLNNNPIHFAAQVAATGALLAFDNINAQHTLGAYAKMPRDRIEWVKVWIDLSESAEMTGQWYAKIDAGKARTQNDANRARQLHRKIGFNTDDAGVIRLCNEATRAAPYVASGFRLGRRDTGIRASTQDTKISVATNFGPELRQFWGLTAPLRERLAQAKASKDRRWAEAVKPVTDVFEGLMRAPVLAAILAGLRHRNPAMTAFLREVVALVVSPLGSAEPPKGRLTAAAYRAVAVGKAMDWLMEPLLNYTAAKRPNYAVWFIGHFFAFDDGRKLSLPEESEITADLIDRTWAALTGQPFTADSLRIGSAAVEDAPRLYAAPPKKKPVGRPSRRTRVLEEA